MCMGTELMYSSWSREVKFFVSRAKRYRPCSLATSAIAYMDFLQVRSDLDHRMAWVGIHLV